MRARLPAEKLSFAARRHSCQPRAAEENFEQAYTRLICVRNTRAGGSPEAPSMRCAGLQIPPQPLIIATGKQHVRQLAEPMRGRVERISMAESHLWHSNFARRRACLSIMQGRKTPTIRPIQSTIHIVAPPHVASAIGAIGQVPSETAGPRSTEAGQDDEECLGPRVPSPLGRNPRDRRWWAITMLGSGATQERWGSD